MSTSLLFKLLIIRNKTSSPKDFKSKWIWKVSWSKTRIPDVSPGKTEVKQGKFVKIYITSEGLF